MITSMACNLLKNARLLKCTSKQFQHKVRNAHQWKYRTITQEHSKFTTYTAEIVMGITWWWILWHLWTEPGHVFGEFEYPVASKWTDEELGIPQE